MADTNSIVDFLKSEGKASDFSSRSQLAQQQGIANYSGTAAQNIQLLGILRGAGASPTVTPTPPIAPPTTTPPVVAPPTTVPPPPTPQVQTSSIVDFLKSTGQASDFGSRTKLAEQFGITGYRGTASQNIQLLNLVRSGQAPPTAPPVAPTPEVDPVVQQRNDAADIANKDAEDIFNEIKTNDVGVRDSSKIISDIREEFEETAEKIPEPTSLVDMFKEQKEALGIEPLETELSDIDANIDRINAELLVQAEEAGEKVLSTREIGRAKGVLQKRADRKIALLNVERTAVARQLGNKLDSLEMIMNFSQQDFQNSSDYYNDKYNRTVQLYNIVSEEADRGETDARATWDVITNSMKDSGVSYGELTSDQQLKLKQLEVQSGLPEGFTEKMMATVDQAKEVRSKIVSSDKSQLSIIYEDGTVEVFSTGLTPEPTKPTSGEKDQAEIDTITNTLTASRKGGEHVDGNVYLEERRKSSLGPTEFDKRFGDLLSPSDRKKFDIGKEAGEKGFGTASELSEAKRWLSKQPGVTDEDKKRLETDEDFFFWVIDQSEEL